jgi:hypothetical protein
VRDSHSRRTDPAKRDKFSRNFSSRETFRDSDCSMG